MERSDFMRAGGLAAGVAFVNLSKTAVLDHRHWTHDSIAFENPTHEKIARTSGAHLTDTKAWASVHTIHHSTPDANLLPFAELADYLDWHEAQTTLRPGQLEIPDTVRGFDPAIPELDVETAREIGVLARELVADFYTPQANYTAEEAHDIMLSPDDKFRYESQQAIKQARRNPIHYDPENTSLHDMRFMLRDPHSPALHDKGILGILAYNVPLYGYVEQSFQDPRFRLERLQPDDWDETLRENRAKLRWGYVGAMALATIAANRSKTPGQAAGNAVLGAAASGLAVVGLIQGGNITNALGHGGDWKKYRPSDIREGVVHVKPDGTYTSNSKTLSAPTLDEVGGQYEHHEDPSRIAYTTQEGWKRWAYAPYGRFLEKLIDKGVLLKEGGNFGGDHRPDLPSDAVLLIEKTRRQHIGTEPSA